MQRENIRLMYEAVKKNRGFDAVVVVSSTPFQSEFWKQRLEESRGEIIGENTRIFSVDEDWPDGAGQLLGTLYAVRRVDGLMEILQDGGRAAI